mmetsp:Transcript_14864/g.29188  ORF Transcript_14864/g.29188 Transcript_14864/m.29188 type:complete len:243 (+) Transcript_14864:182-910(+)
MAHVSRIQSRILSAVASWLTSSMTSCAPSTNTGSTPRYRAVSRTPVASTMKSSCAPTTKREGRVTPLLVPCLSQGASPSPVAVRMGRRLTTLERSKKGFLFSSKRRMYSATRLSLIPSEKKNLLHSCGSLAAVPNTNPRKMSHTTSVPLSSRKRLDIGPLPLGGTLQRRANPLAMPGLPSRAFMATMPPKLWAMITGRVSGVFRCLRRRKRRKSTTCCSTFGAPVSFSRGSGDCFVLRSDIA